MLGINKTSMWDKILAAYFKGDIEDLALIHAKFKYVTNAKKFSDY